MQYYNQYGLKFIKRACRIFLTGILLYFLLNCFLFAASSMASSQPDDYESDDSADLATTFYLFSSTYQSRNFHDQGDEDWLIFYTDEAFGAVEIKTYDPEENCETVITLFDSDKTTQLKEQRFTLSSGINLLSFRPEKDGVYYVRIKNKDSSKYGDKTGYKLSIYFPVAPFSGTVDGIVTDSSTGLPIQGVQVNVENNYSGATTGSDGFYFFQCPAGEFTLYASKEGYSDYSTDIEVGEIQRTELNFSLSTANGVSCKTYINGAAIGGSNTTGSPLSFGVNTQNSCGSSAYYRYSVHSGYGTPAYDGRAWESLTDSEWVSDNTIGYTFTQKDKYIVVVWLTEETGNVDPVGIPIVGWSVNLNDETCKTDITGYDISGNLETGNPVTFTVNAANDCSETLYYRFSVHPDYGTDGYNGQKWTSMTSSQWVMTNAIDYTFAAKGKYIVVVWVTDDMENVDPNGIPIIGWSVDIE